MALNKTQIATVRREARAVGMPTAFALGLIDKESAGRVLYPVNGEMLPAIRIEGHYFDERLSGVALKTAREQGLASPKVGGVKNPTTMAGRYAMLDRMIAIDRRAAYQSISVGVGQVMLSHWSTLGYSSPEAMFSNACTFAGQVEQMFGFVKYVSPKALAAAKRYDYKAFALIYNGKGAKKSYWEDLETFTNKWAAYDGVDAPDDHPDEWTVRILALGYKNTEDFQTARNLKPDGRIGPLTKEAVAAAEAEKATAKAAPVKSAVRIVGAVGAVAAPVVVADNPDTAASVLSGLEPVTQLVTSIAPLGAPILLAGLGIVVAWAGYKAIVYWTGHRADLAAN